MNRDEKGLPLWAGWELPKKWNWKAIQWVLYTIYLKWISHPQPYQRNDFML